MTTKWFFIFLSAASFSLAGCQQESNNTANEEEQVEADTTATEPADDKSKRPSPPDSTMATLGDLTVESRSGSPSVKGRERWGGLVPYGEVWRTGANEATTFKVSSDVLVNGNAIPAGTYSLFTIPGESTWTVILNKTANLWGSYEYNAEEDALRFDVQPMATDEFSERMKLTAEAKESSIEVRFHWEKLTFTFPVAKP